jgi:hypothetical protein
MKSFVGRSILRENLNVKLFERYIKEHFGETLAISPVNSMTPFVVRMPDGTEEYIFVVKAESWLYEPLKGKSINDVVPMSAKAYLENGNLIFGFDVQPDISLESEIPKEKIKGFLQRLYKQEVLTVVIVDHITTNIVWLTNNFPFWRVKSQFRPLFDYFGVK